MCVIIVKPRGEKIDEQVIINSAKQNSDGYGLYAYNEDDKKIFRTENYDHFKEVIDKYNNENFFLAAHFRLTSAGANKVKNLHPFPITDDWWMFHNGHFDAADYSKKLSDTNIVSQKLRNIKDFGANAEALSELMENLTFSRVVFVRGNEYHIANEEMGTWEGRIWYSQDMPLKRVPIFIYGTLKKGSGNHYAYLNNARFVGYAHTKEKHGLRISGLPKLTRENYAHVKGELYLVDKNELEEIDLLEGHPDHYKRDLISVQTTTHTFIAWAYYLDERNGTLTDEYLSQIAYGYGGYRNTKIPSHGVNQYPYKDWELDEWWNQWAGNESCERGDVGQEPSVFESGLEEIEDFFDMVDSFEAIYGEPFPEDEAQKMFNLMGFTGTIEDDWEALTPTERRYIIDEMLNGESVPF